MQPVAQEIATCFVCGAPTSHSELCPTCLANEDRIMQAAKLRHERRFSRCHICWSTLYDTAITQDSKGNPVHLGCLMVPTTPLAVVHPPRG